jgi:hypothetical protein
MAVLGAAPIDRRCVLVMGALKEMLVEGRDVIWCGADLWSRKKGEPDRRGREFGIVAGGIVEVPGCVLPISPVLTT